MALLDVAHLEAGYGPILGPLCVGLASFLLIGFWSHKPSARAAAWKAFRDDPEGVKVRTASELGGKLTAKVESIYLNPTDFSKIR